MIPSAAVREIVPISFKLPIPPSPISKVSVLGTLPTLSALIVIVSSESPLIPSISIAPPSEVIVKLVEASRSIVPPTNLRVSS